jgi:alpha-ketoglutarate-dependent taurine dioxygenase
LHGAAAAVIEIRPLRVSLGARIAGADLAHLDNRAFNQLFRALLEHRLLRIEGQSVSAAKFREFALRFGELLPAASSATPPHPRYADIAVLGGAVEQDGNTAQAMVLYALEIRESPADSVFAGVPDTEMALPAPQRDKLDGAGRETPGRATGSADADYRHRWRAGDVLVWDSQCVVHRAADRTSAAGTFYRAAIAAASH